jgi:glycosyltransferase involved in cell wall biosynthesis
LAAPFLSIIIPAYNEQNRLPTTLSLVNDFIQRQSFDSEVLVVENGSNDSTLEIAVDFANRHPCFEVIHEEQRGKGQAVKRGMLEARGEFRFMCDADLSMPVTEIPRFLPPLLADFDIAIGSREAPGARRIHEPIYRHLGGRAINFMIRVLALPGFHDTQCGFKCFRANVAVDLFESLTLKGWSFDIEVLYIARLRGYRIREIPIPWYFNPESKLSLVVDTIRMGIDILKIRRNDWVGHYAPQNLRSQN